MALQYVLIDLDGTVWDSAPWYASLVCGVDPEEQHRVAQALSNPGGGVRIASLLKDKGLGPAKFRGVCEEHASALRLYDGVLNVLGSLVGDVALGVVTSLPTWVATPMLESVGLARLFSVVQCAQWRLPPKPNPRGIQMALGQLSADPDSSAYVGDTLVDQQAAHRAGVAFALASWGYGGNIPDADIRLDGWPDLRQYA